MVTGPLYLPVWRLCVLNCVRVIVRSFRIRCLPWLMSCCCVASHFFSLVLCAFAVHCLAVDFIFSIDLSGSMNPNINAVRRGLVELSNAIESTDINATFSVVAYTYNPNSRCTSNVTIRDDNEILLEQGTIAEVQDVLSRVDSNGAVPGLHLPHTCCAENGIETLLMALNVAGATSIGSGDQWLYCNESVYMRPKCHGYGVTGRYKPLTLRPTSKKAVIWVTDEIDAYPMWTPNRIMPTKCGSQVVQNGMSIAQFYDEGVGSLIKLAAQRIAAANASVYLFADVDAAKSECDTNTFDTLYASPQLVEFQYGSAACAVEAVSGRFFQPAATLTKLENTGLGQSLQAEVLRAGGYMRLFSLAPLVNAANSDKINNIMRAIVGDVGKCEESAKRADGASCFQWLCDSARGCYKDYFCDDEVQMECGNCMIDGVCVPYGEPNPFESCEFCNGFALPTTYTPCNEFTSLTSDTCKVAKCDTITNTCRWDAPSCVAECGYCSIEGAGECIDAGATNAKNGCQVCNASASATNWTEVCTCNPACLVRCDCRYGVFVRFCVARVF